MLWFHEHHETLLSDKYPKIEEYPLYKYLKQFSNSYNENGKQQAETEKKAELNKEEKENEGAAA